MDISSIKASNPVTPMRDTAPKTQELRTAELKEVSANASATRKQVEEAVATIQEFVQASRRNINFSVDDGSGRVFVRVTDAGSGAVIRQIPSEEALRLAENLTEVRSVLFEAQA